MILVSINIKLICFCFGQNVLPSLLSHINSVELLWVDFLKNLFVSAVNDFLDVFVFLEFELFHVISDEDESLNQPFI